MKKEISKSVREALKSIPSIDEIINQFPAPIPQDFYKFHLNHLISNIRNKILLGDEVHNVKEFILSESCSLSKTLINNSLQPVINGTGIILHTGLGRAPISKDILIDGVLKNYPYSNLEIDIKTGKRGDRNDHIVTLFRSLCNCDDAIMVNNNASAVMLMLNSICEDREVIVSRGQLVEIGGSFRIPDVIKKSQCKMVEVGTTNKTHLLDYEKAINKNTAAILYVHTSNYKVIGFTNEIDITELSILSKKYNIPLLIDLGSGSLADFKFFGLPMEKMIKKYIKTGADLITFSGDKLLGGPQAGIILGSKKNLEIIRSNPIYRAVRCDKIRISIMETILRTYYSSKNIESSNLSIKLFKRTKSDLLLISRMILDKISDSNIKNYDISVKDSFVEAGSGSLPTEKIDSIALTFTNNKISANYLYNKFLNSSIPTIGYVKNNIYHIDLKAIPKDQVEHLIISINKTL